MTLLEMVAADSQNETLCINRNNSHISHVQPAHAVVLHLLEISKSQPSGTYPAKRAIHAKHKKNDNKGSYMRKSHE